MKRAKENSRLNSLQNSRRKKALTVGVKGSKYFQRKSSPGDKQKSQFALKADYFRDTEGIRVS